MFEIISDVDYEFIWKIINCVCLERIIFGFCRDVLCVLLRKKIDLFDLLYCVNNFIGNFKRKKFLFISE